MCCRCLIQLAILFYGARFFCRSAEPQLSEASVQDFMAARCAWIDEGEGAGGLLVMLGVLLAMLPQLRGVETEVRFHAPEAVRVSSKAASLAPTTPSILELIHVQSTLCASHGNPACQPVTPSRFWHDMFFLHAFCVGFCTDVTLIFLHDFAC